MISNVPGPDFPLYFAGMELRAVYPLGPVMHGVAPINITVQSYLDSLFVGINAASKASPDLAGLARRMEEELGLLSKMVNGAGPPRSAAVRHRRTPQAGGHRRAQSISSRQCRPPQRSRRAQRSRLRPRRHQPRARPTDGGPLPSRR